MWAITRDTKGNGGGFSDANANALCANPDLRSLRPGDLADALGVSHEKAQRAINTVAAVVGGSDDVPQGASLDECFADLGRSARPSQVLFAPNAAGIFAPTSPNAGDTAGQVQQPAPWGLFALLVGVAFVVDFGGKKRRR